MWSAQVQSKLNILFLPLSQHCMCFQSFVKKKLKDMAGSYCVSVQLVFASVFCANTIKSSYRGHTEVLNSQHPLQSRKFNLALFGCHIHILPSRKQNPSPPPLQSKHTELWAASSPWITRALQGLVQFLFQKYCEQEANLWPILPFISQITPAGVLCINLVRLFHSETSCSVCFWFLVLCSWECSRRHGLGWGWSPSLK